jgi:hypothetical protein
MRLRIWLMPEKGKRSSKTHFHGNLCGLCWQGTLGRNLISLQILLPSNRQWPPEGFKPVPKVRLTGRLHQALCPTGSMISAPTVRTIIPTRPERASGNRVRQREARDVALSTFETTRRHIGSGIAWSNGPLVITVDGNQDSEVVSVLR